MPSYTRIQPRRDTAANWAAADPILAMGELGYETDTKRIKRGDGATAWSGLTYALTEVGASTAIDTHLGGDSTDLVPRVDTLEAAAPRIPPAGAVAGDIYGHDGTDGVWRTLAEAGIVASSKGVLYGEDGRVYKLLSGVIRNDGAGWAFIDDAGHRPSGFTTVTVNADNVQLNYAAGVKVSSLQVTPDETLAALGYRCGASVDLDNTKVFIYREPTDRISDYITYTQSTGAWASLNGGFTAISYNASTSILTLTHPSMGIAPGIGIAANGRGGTCQPQVEGVGDTTTTLSLYTMAGALKGALTADVKLWVTRYGARALTTADAEDPTTVVSATGNLWVTGLTEV